jgi:cation transport ATPase
MNTFIILFILLVGGAFIGWITTILLPIVGIIGEGIAGAPEKRSKLRLSIGILIGTILQSYFYFSYVALIVGWINTKINYDSWTKFIFWIISFLVCIFPIFLGAVNAKNHHNNKQTGYYSAIAESMRISANFSIIGFFLFIFYPTVMKILWFWVPFV